MNPIVRVSAYERPNESQEHYLHEGAWLYEMGLINIQL